MNFWRYENLFFFFFLILLCFCTAETWIIVILFQVISQNDKDTTQDFHARFTFVFLDHTHDMWRSNDVT